MAEITPERTGELIRKVFQILWNHPDGLPVDEILARIVSSGWVTEADRETIPEFNIPIYEQALWRGMLPLARVGWLYKKRDRWSVTEAGRQTCQRISTAAEFFSEAAKVSEDWQREQLDLSLITDIAENMAWKQIRQYLRGLNRHEFLSLVADLLCAMNYHLGWVAPPEKVHGQIDIIAFTDPLGANGHRIKAHVQHSGQAIMLEGLRTFISTLSPGDVGLLVASGGFTPSARDFMRTRTDVQVTLLDMEGFLDFWIDFYQALSDDARQRFSLKAIHFLDI